MTQEEKAYNEAIYNNYKSFNELVERLESVKSAIKEHNYGIAMDTLYKPYPEFQITTSTKLKESDERIRDEIVIYIGAKNDISLNTHNRWLSWLEKQGEQKSVEWSEKDEHWRQKAIDFMKHPDWIKTTPTLVKDTIDWLKSLRNRINNF